MTSDLQRAALTLVAEPGDRDIKKELQSVFSDTDGAVIDAALEWATEYIVSLRQRARWAAAQDAEFDLDLSMHDTEDNAHGSSEDTEQHPDDQGHDPDDRPPTRPPC